ncbi:MAG: hypothetical protein M5U28_48420 [Sandaracinaceae bacterium]|nr:hypothetical protein [Sandaracinaceae bacterium]
MSRKTYTTQIKLLLCQQCGAPLELPPAGGTAACSYCRAQNVVRSGAGAAAFAPPSSLPIDESERLRRLRMQDGKPFVPPASIQPLVDGGGLHPAKVEEAFHIYQATRREVLATHSPEAAERLFALTLIANTHLARGQDHVRRRAILETSLSTLDLPRHQQVIRCLLATASAKEGDLASAADWLAPCNPRSDDLDSDSAFRVARAFVDTFRGDFAAVYDWLGPLDDGYPIADTWDPTAAVLRANALERLGNLQAAVQALRDRMGKESVGGRATMEAIVAAHPELALCAQSFPLATQGHAQLAADAMSSQSGGGVGAIFYYVGLGIIVLGALLAVGLFAAMSLSGLSDAGGAELGLGVGAFSAFMALVCTVPLGAIFFFVGRALKKKGEKAAWLRVHGIQAKGRVRGVSPTGMSINDVPMMRIEVEVLHPQVAPYLARFELLFDASMASTFAPGALVPLRVHPQQPADVIVET